MAATTLSFADADGVSGDPVLDGMIDYDFMPFLADDPVEHGYVNGSRLTAQGGGFLPSAIFQGVRHRDGRLFLGFLCRFDTSFGTDDWVAVAFRGADATLPQRVVHIFPSLDDVGAGNTANPPGIDAPDPGNPGESGTDRRTNRVPNLVTWWKKKGAETAFVQSSQPAGVDIRVRSWKPGRTVGAAEEFCWSVELSVPLAAAGAGTAPDGDNLWLDLKDNFDLYFSIFRTSPAGAVPVLSFPTNQPPTSEPGIDFNVPAWGKGLIPALQSPPNSNYGRGVRFKNDWQGIGRRGIGGALLGSTIFGSGAAVIGDDGLENELVALVENTGSDPANAITAEFRFANWGLTNSWDTPVGLTPNPTPSTTASPPYNAAVNLAAGTPGTPTGGECKAKWPRADVSAAGYGGATHQCMFVTLSSGGGANFTQASVRRNMDFASLSTYEEEADISGEGYPEPASGEHDLVLETFCRPIYIGKLIGQPEITSPELQAFVLEALQKGGLLNMPGAAVATDATHNLALMRRASNNQTNKLKEVVIYGWVTLGYRRTDRTITINGRTYDVLDPGPGAFGVAASHVGLDDAFGFALTGPGLVRYGEGIYGIKVKHKEHVKLQVKLQAERDGPKGELMDLPKGSLPPQGRPGKDQGGPTPGPKPGCTGLLAGMLLLPAGLLAAHHLFG